MDQAMEQTLRDHQAQLEALREIGLELTSELDLDALLHAIASRALELLRGTACGLYLYRPEREVMEWAVSVGSELPSVGAILRRGEGLSGRILETGEPLIVNDYQGWEGRPSLYADYPWTAVLGVPVRWGEELLGVLNVQTDAPRTFSSDDAELLSLFANHAAIAIRNAYLYHQAQQEISDRQRAEVETRRRNRELLALQSASAAIGSSLDIQYVLEAVAREMADLLGVESCCFSDWDRTLDAVLSIAEYPLDSWRGDEPEDELYYLSDYPATRQVLVEQRAIQMTTSRADIDPAELAYMRKAKIKTFMMVPMISQSQAMGLVELEDGRSERTFTEHEILLAQALANQAASAIQNARLYQQAQQEIAQRERIEEDLRQALAQLASSEKQYRNFVEQSSEGIWLLEFDRPISTVLPPEEQVRRIQNEGYVAECNDALTRMYGYSSGEDMIGTRLMDLYGGEDNERNFQSTLALVTSGYRGDDRETQEFDSRGERIYFLNNAVGIVHDQHLVGIWGVQRDITALKQAEAEREVLIAELEAKNAELERFAFTVSHDLKNPLITIQGFLGYLEQDAVAGDTARVKADISRISSADQKMEQMLNELLELSRIGRVVGPQEEISLSELVREATDTMAGRLAERDVIVEIEPDLPVVYGDRARLLQVLENLMDNAVKFMGDQPEPRVEIGIRWDDQKAVIYVQDNGMGIDPRYHEKVFGLFEKLNAESKGSGVGLAIVHRIIELQGGQIWVESEGDGRGSTFCFILYHPPSPDLAWR